MSDLVSKEFGGTQIDPFYCFLRCVEIEGEKYPFQIVLVGESESSRHRRARWSTKIRPAESWPGDEIRKASYFDLTDAPSVEEAARVTWKSILRAQTGRVMSVKIEHISDLLDRFLTAAGPDFPPKIDDSKYKTRMVLEVATLSEWPTCDVFKMWFSVADLE